MKNFNPEELNKKTVSAQEQIQEGQKSLEEIQRYVADNLPDLIASASAEYQESIKTKIQDALAKNDLENVKILIKEIESHIQNLVTEKGLTPEQIEQFTKEYDAFWKDTYKTWNSSLDTSSITFTPEFTSTINFKDLAQEPDDTTKFGQYLTNPETAFLDYETLGEPEIFDPNTNQEYQAWLVQHKKTKSVASVMDYVHGKYALIHHLPGIEYHKYLFENPDKVPQSMRDGNWYYFPSTAFRDSGGSWFAPYGHWDSGVWDRHGRDVGLSWRSGGRVVLFGK